MKISLILFTALCLVFSAVPLLGEVADQVNIGDPAWEVGHSMIGWGDVQYGDLHDPPGPYGSVENCRGIDCPVSMGDGDTWAEITMFFGTLDPGFPRYISMRHLEGQATDAFDLYIYEEGGTPPGSLVLSYPGDPESTVMIWHVSTVEDVYLAGYNTLRFVSTAEHWSGWETYGQVYFDWILVTDSFASPVRESSWGAIKAMFN